MLKPWRTQPQNLKHPPDLREARIKTEAVDRGVKETPIPQTRTGILGAGAEAEDVVADREEATEETGVEEGEEAGTKPAEERTGPQNRQIDAPNHRTAFLPVKAPPVIARPEMPFMVRAKRRASQ